MIFFKKDTVHGVDLEYAINNAVFPGLQVSRTSSFCSAMLSLFFNDDVIILLSTILFLLLLLLFCSVPYLGSLNLLSSVWYIKRNITCAGRSS